MNPPLAIPAGLTTAAIPAKVLPTADAAKVREAGQQFEALLLNQILQTVSETGGWLGSGEDSSSACATGLAQQQLASVMAKNGGIGLAALISQGLRAGARGPGSKAD